jgi:hypothetical protein
MEASPVSKKRRSLATIIAQWLQDWRSKRADLAESRKLPQDRVQHAADELGLTADEVRTISDKAHYTSNLLPLRMSLLRLDGDKIACSDPKLLSELQTSCKLCDVKGRCTRDIAENAANPQWEAYCPNAVKLRAMQAGTPPKTKSR